MNQKTVGVGVLDNPHFEGNNQKGITLIALVITIIVLLILAGVTINMVLGEDGIIGQAQGASEAQKNAEQKQQHEINNAYKEILRTEKNLSGIGTSSEDSEEVTTIIKTADSEGNVTEEESKNNFYDSLVVYKALDSVKYNGNIEEAKANANIIKLNKRIYTDMTIHSIGMSENQSLVIDLNGYELIYTGTYEFVTSILGELYIIDTSENKTGKIIMLEQVNENYTYQEKYDIDRDGRVCSYDVKLVENAFGKRKTDSDWEQYSNCDFDGRGVVDFNDVTRIASQEMYYHLIYNYANVYTDVAEGAFISQCIHNK